jgi:hypothetical protein
LIGDFRLVQTQLLAMANHRCVFSVERFSFIWTHRLHIWDDVLEATRPDGIRTCTRCQCQLVVYLRGSLGESHVLSFHVCGSRKVRKVADARGCVHVVQWLGGTCMLRMQFADSKRWSAGHPSQIALIKLNLWL